MSLIGKSVGHIRIEGLIGRGGMGEVYRGFDDTLQRKVAVKSIAATALLTPDLKSRFLREARALSRLEHPNICKIHDFIESEGTAFLVLEFIEGRTLAQALRDGIDKPDKLRDRPGDRPRPRGRPREGHRPQRPQAVQRQADARGRGQGPGLRPGPVPRPGPDGPAAAAADDAFDEPHAEDEGPTPPLPSELALGQTLSLDTPTRSSSRPSEFLSDSLPTEQGAIMGTPQYMSPEQARGDRATPASDMYSFGLILQELFTGRPAHEATDDRAKLFEWARKGQTVPVAGLPSDLTALINRLKSLSPAARPTAVEAVERLVRIQEKPRRRLRRAIVGGVALAFVLAGVKYTVDLGRQQRQALQARDEATNVVKFLVNLFSVSDPGEARGNTITAREVLDKGAREIGQGLEKQPLTKARMMDTIGTVFRKLGLYPQAEPLVAGALDIREKLLGPADLQVAESLLSLAALRQRQGKFQEAKTLFQRALDIRTKALPPGDPLIAEAQLGLGEIHFELNELADAEALYKKSLEIREKALGPDHPDVAGSLLDLGWLYYNDSQFEKAEGIYKRSLAILEKSLGPDHPDVADNLGSLGALCLWLRRYKESGGLLPAGAGHQGKGLRPRPSPGRRLLRQPRAPSRIPGPVGRGAGRRREGLGHPAQGPGGGPSRPGQMLFLAGHARPPAGPFRGGRALLQAGGGHHRKNLRRGLRGIDVAARQHRRYLPDPGPDGRSGGALPAGPRQHGEGLRGRTRQGRPSALLAGRLPGRRGQGRRGADELRPVSGHRREGDRARELQGRGTLVGAGEVRPAPKQARGGPEAPRTGRGPVREGRRERQDPLGDGPDRTGLAPFPRRQELRGGRGRS